MTISLSETSKRFNREWIFLNFDYTFNPSQSYAIIGPNGSGKSTLLQIIGGAMVASTGKIIYTNSSGQIDPEDVYKYIAYSAPYLELIEEMSVTELLGYHGKFKPFFRGSNISEMIQLGGLHDASHKQIRYYSSGMKQRVKLLQAIFSDTPCILLDEPCTNLDEEGIALYKQLIDQFCRNRLVIISSNDPVEYEFCDTRIDISSFHGKRVK